MRRFSWIIAIVVVISTTGPIAAGGPQYGMGVKSCGQFAKDYASNPQVAEVVYFSWAEGFMSGMNAELQATNGAYREIEGGDARMEQYKSTIRTYCDKHPLAPYFAAVLDLYFTLPLSRKNSN